MSDKHNPERGLGLTLPALALTRAGGNTKPAPAPVYLLADHLDTVLAACEDIVNARLTWNRARRAGQLEIAVEKHNNRDDIEDIRKLENTIIIRVLKSRERAEDVARADKRFRQLAKLYVAGTAVLLDAVEECGDSTDTDFATADSIPAYLRSRGLIDPDAPAPDIGENLQVGEDFLIAKRIVAGPLMDLAAALLDALELHYDLFLDENELAMAPQINRFEDDDVTEADDIFSVEGGLKVKDPALEAAIEDVREEVSQKEDTSIEPSTWAKMGAAGSVIPPVVTRPEPDPLVVVSKIETDDDNSSDLSDDSHTEGDTTASLSVSAPLADPIAQIEQDEATADAADEATDDESSESNAAPLLAASTPLAAPVEISSLEDEEKGSSADLTEKVVSEDDVPTEIMTMQRSASDDGADVDEQSETTAAADDTDIEIDADLDCAAEQNDDNDQAEVAGLDAAADDAVEEAGETATKAEENDDVLIITAANDDDTDPDDSDDVADPELSEGETSVEATTSDEGTSDQQDTSEDHAKAVAADSASSDEPDENASKPVKKKKSKSLLSRLSLIKS